MKVCKICGAPRLERYTLCREHANERRRNQYASSTPEQTAKRAECQKRYNQRRAADPEFHERDKERHRRHNARRRDEVNAANRKWRSENRARFYGMVQAWRAANPEKVAEYRRRERERDKAKREAKRPK